jgi:hypothetical protein
MVSTGVDDKEMMGFDEATFTKAQLINKNVNDSNTIDRH